LPGSGEHTLGHSEEWFRHFEVLTTLVARRLGRLQPRELSTRQRRMYSDGPASPAGCGLPCDAHWGLRRAVVNLAPGSDGEWRRTNDVDPE
jgi:hypothetical protein